VTAHGPVPFLGGHDLMIFLLQVGLLLALAVVLGRVAVHFRLPAIVGELLAGVLLGPSVLQRALPRLSGWLLPANPAQFHLLDAFGQIGVVLLVGVTGTQLDFGLVRRRGATAVRVAVPGLLLPLALGVAGGFLMPAALLAHGSDRVVFALFLGVAMSVSAIPVIAKTLLDMGLLHRNIGQLTMAAGTLDDTFGWLMLSVVAAMATTGLRAATVGRQVGLLVAFLVAVGLVGRPLVRTVMRAASRADGDGPVTGCAVVIMILGAAATQAMGLEAVFGAFVAGIVVGTCGYPDPARLASLRTVALAVIAPVFFATAGLRIDLSALGRPVVLLFALLMLAVAIAGKFAGAFVGAKASRMSGWEAVALGAGMNSRGVVQLVIATVGLQLGVLTTATYTIVVLIAITTSLMAAPILRAAIGHVDDTAEEQLRAVALSGGSAGASSAPAA
jgi:Kef-type K+ transport system membrane component KefB